MDDLPFDALTKQFAKRNRRSVLKSIIGLGGIVLSASAIVDDAGAARRGFSGPTFHLGPSPTPTCAPFGEPCSLDNPGACCSHTCAESGGPIGTICA